MKMRLLNQDKNISIKNILILLTKDEAIELRDDLNKLLSNDDFAAHTHINDNVFEHEITMAIYEENELEYFDQRTKKLILEDE